MSTNSNVFASLSEGDLIKFDGRAATKSPHTVDDMAPSGGMVGVTGPRGAEKVLIQNKHNPDSISIMSLGTTRPKAKRIKNLRVVG